MDAPILKKNKTPAVVGYERLDKTQKQAKS